MSLADELLADLEADEDGENDNSERTNHELPDSSEIPLGDTVPMEQEPEAYSLTDVAKLYRGTRLKDAMDRIENFSSVDRKKGSEDMQGPVEADPEYLLIVEANNLAAQIDEEIGNVHKFAKDKYSKRFPELETLVVQPLNYLMTARELGNTGLVNVQANKNLEPFLNQATIMVVSVTASTTQGTEISQDDLAVVSEACDIALKLNDYKKRIFDYVESRMAFIAPNLSTIIGASTAAKLMGAAGGLTALSKMPANHVALLGQQKKVLAGYSQSSTLPHTGFIYYSDLVQKLPPDLRRKVARVVGSKCALAARVDSFHEQHKESIGQAFREEIEKKIEKERYAVTELRKQANRMNFGELNEDIYQNDLGLNRGNIGKSGIGGGIRMAQIDERTKVRVSQTLKKNLQKQQAWGGASTVRRRGEVSGTASSVAFTPLQARKKIKNQSSQHQGSGTSSSIAFTPLQGLEIVNPQAAEKRVDEANAKYFSPSASFMKVKTPLPGVLNSKTTYNQ